MSTRRMHQKPAESWPILIAVYVLVPFTALLSWRLNRRWAKQNT